MSIRDLVQPGFFKVLDPSYQVYFVITKTVRVRLEGDIGEIKKLSNFNLFIDIV